MAKGKTRRKKVPSNLRKVIAENVNKLADKVFAEAENVPVAIAEASKTARVNPLVKSTVQRIMAAETSATLEQLEGLAEALEVSVYQLLIPHLDPKNPQIAKGASRDERDLYERLEKLEQAVSKSGPKP